MGNINSQSYELTEEKKEEVMENKTSNTGNGHGLFATLTSTPLQDLVKLEDETKSWYWVLDQLMNSIYTKFSKDEVMAILDANPGPNGVSFENLNRWYNHGLASCFIEEQGMEMKLRFNVDIYELVDKLRNLNNLEIFSFAKWLDEMWSDSIGNDPDIRSKIWKQELEKFTTI